MTQVRVFLLNTEVKTQNKYITLSIHAALVANPNVEAVISGQHGTAVRDFIDGKCDVFIAFGGAGAHAPLLARLCGMAKVSVLWTTEDPYELEANVRLSDIFDVVFTNDLASVPAYNGRAIHLPLAASELFNDFPVLDRDSLYRYDVLFIGTAWPNRVQTINKIVRHFRSRLRMKIALPYNEFLKRPKLADPDLIINWRCSNVDFAQLANRSRVVLSIQRNFSAASKDQASGSTPPPRLFEVALAGGFQVCISDSTEANRYFEPGTEYVPSEDDDQAIAAIENALKAPAQRMNIARAARARAMAEHTYRHRVEQIMARLLERLERKSVTPSLRSKQTLLVVTHNVLQEGNFGGIEVYQEHLKALHKFRVLFLYPKVDATGLTLRVIDRCNQVVDYPVETQVTRYQLSNPAVENMFERILFEQRVDLVHFQHLLGYPLSLPLVARASGVPSIWTCHDHYLICDRYTLLDFEGKFCDTANKTNVHCDICLDADGGQPNGSQARRRNFVSMILDAFDTIVTNTPFTSSYLTRIYPELAPSKLRVVEMLLPEAKPAKKLKVASSGTGIDEPEVLDVVIPGNFTVEKGGHCLIRLFYLTRDDDIKYTILGRCDAHFSNVFDSLGLKNVSVRGGYVHSEILDILRDFDVSLHVSIWPETYMIALSEAWSAGLIPIVTDLGAQSERVTDGVDGFKVPPHDPASIAICLRRIQSGDIKRDKICAAIAAKALATPERHLAQLQSIYEDVINRYPVTAVRNVLRYRRYFSMTAFDAGVRTNAAIWNTREVVWDQPLDNPAQTTVVPLSVLLDGVPSRYAHLQRKAMSIRDPSVRWWLDDVSLDGDPTTDIFERFVARHSIRLRGWIDIDNPVALVEAVIELKGPFFSVLATASWEARQDVSKALNRPYVVAGFDILTPLDALPEDLYEINAVHVYDGSIVTINGLGQLKIGDGSAADGEDDWANGLDSFIAERPVIAVEAVKVGLEIAPAETAEDGVIHLPAKSRFSLKGWTEIVEGYELAPRVAVVLEKAGEGQAVWTQAARCRRQKSGKVDPMLAYSGFVVDADLAPNMLGTYRLKILQDLRGVVGASDLGTIYIRDPQLPADVFLEDAEFLLAQPVVNVDLGAADFSFVIDSASTGNTLKQQRYPAEDDASYVRGWMFHRGLGSPRYFVISWQEDGRKLLRKVSAHPRPDVAEHIGEPKAEACGFRFYLPPETGDLKSMSCYQVYEEETIAFSRFGALMADLHAKSKSGTRAGRSTIVDTRTVAVDAARIGAGPKDKSSGFRRLICRACSSMSLRRR